MLLLIPSATAYELSNDNYQMNIGIVSGKNLTNNNYKFDVNVYPVQKNLTNNNYKLNFGYLMNWLVAEEAEEVVSDVSGAGAVAAQTAILTPIACNESGFIWYEGMCYECDGFILERDGIIVCAHCPEEYEYLDGKCRLIEEAQRSKIWFFLTIALISAIIITLLAKKTKKQKKKRLEKLIKKEKKVTKIE